MFGVSDDRLIENLETIRKQLCCYFGTTCDCKFLNGSKRGSEQTGCAELRQVVEYVKGKRDEVVILEKILEDSAANTLAAIRRLVCES